MSDWAVIKFGGTSVSTRDNWNNITQIVQERLKQGKRVVIVCSALTKISKLLDQLISAALTGSAATICEDIRQRYADLATALGQDASLTDRMISELKQLVNGIELVREATPRTRAQVLAFGELILTKLGYAFLNAQGIETDWYDIRRGLIADNDRQQSTKHYLSATCDAKPDPHLLQQLRALNNPVVITQGFIASDQAGDTVLFGWGGSDISAAYIAAKLQAAQCEIWTDVPGIYTANPHQIPQARLLKQLDYDEAQEIAAMGAKVLHPKTIPPLREALIPIRIGCTQRPEQKGTLITSDYEAQGLRIKSILTKYHITLITIETLLMWRQSGFMASVFNCFKEHDISIDLITTSESSITVSLDNQEQFVDDKRVERLLRDLNEFSQARVIAPCAQVTLVGRHMRAALHQFGPVFEVFESQQIHLLSQSANDLNLSFIVNEDQAEKIAKKLHTLLVEHNPESYYYSKSWQEDFVEQEQQQAPWWVARADTLLEIAKKKSPCYVYDQETCEIAAKKLLACKNFNSVFFAMKANSNPQVLKTFYDLGIGFECVSLGEIELILAIFPKISRDRILFTPNFAPRAEYEAAFKYGVHVTIDALYPLENWPEVFKNRSVLLRIDPGVGLGHHRYVCTGGNESKFGIPQSSLPELVQIVQKNHIDVFGLHAHHGSGILQSYVWQTTAELLTSLLFYFPSIKVINLGGGLGVVERPGQQPLDTVAVDKSLAVIKQKHPQLQFWLEPGRFLVAHAGVLLARVTQLKQKGDTHFIGIETGMNSLIRPSLYGAYHEIVNLTRLDDTPNKVSHVVGPICESGDTLGFSRYLPETKEGDILLIANAGAYSYSMSSRYNLREPAAEMMVEKELV